MIKLPLFIKELLFFAMAISVGILSAYGYNQMPDGGGVVVPSNINFRDILSAVLISSLFFLVLIKFRRVARYSLRVFLFLIIFFGSQAVAGSFLSFPLDLIFVIAILFLFQWGSNVLVHNIAIAISIAGISALFGMAISPAIAVLLLAVLSAYDIVAVYLTRHMVALARGMVESGAIFGFIIPLNWKDFMARRDQVNLGEKFMVLGSGDIGLPLILICSVVGQSLVNAIVISVFSLVGLFITHLLFVTQDKRRPMAALPPIATMTVLGYLFTQIFNFPL